MDLSKIRKLSETRSGGMRKLAADAGMSEANLHRCVNNNKISAGDLERIARLLNVPVGYFFDDAPSTTATASGRNSIAAAGHDISVNGASDGDSAVLREKVAYLERIVSEKEKIIEEKERLIKVYEKMTDEKQ